MDMKLLTIAAGTAVLVAALGLAMVLAQAELPPGPGLVHRVSFTSEAIPQTFDVVSLVLDFEPGAWTPLHSHGGQGVVLVLEGEVTTRDAEGMEARFGVGEYWIEMPGHKHKAGNEAQVRARVLFTIALPEGEQLTTVHEE
jgi:quercetin dioxygenase-like cupin family protein